MHLNKSHLVSLLVSTLWMLPAQGSLLVDLDKALIRWSNDDDPWIRVRFQGEIRPVAEVPHYGFPIGPDRSLRFIPCQPPASGSPIGCEIPNTPQGAAGLVVGAPLVVSERMYYTHAWRRGLVNTSPEEDILAIAMRHTGAFLRDKGQLKNNLPDTSTAFQKFLGALSGAKAAGSSAPIIKRADRAARMFAVFRDLWQEVNTYASRDLSMPCSSLQKKAEAFNSAAGADLVRMEKRSPRGVCFFCRNVCTLESAHSLLKSMKQALADKLLDATKSPVQPGL